MRPAPGSPQPNPLAGAGRPLDEAQTFQRVRRWITQRLTIEAIASYWTRLISVGIESFGVAVIVVGIGWSTYVFARDRMCEKSYSVYKVRIGRTLLLGLELLVAADIVKTIALE